MDENYEDSSGLTTSEARRSAMARLKDVLAAQVPLTERQGLSLNLEIFESDTFAEMKGDLGFEEMLDNMRRKIAGIAEE